MGLFKELEARGLIKQVTSDKVQDLLDNSSITFYCGFDPTADSLHVGSLLPLITMKRLKLKGHKPLALVGGATGLVGDPSFKKSERPILSQEQLAINLKGITKNIQQILGDTELINNFDWIKNISLLDFLKFQGKMFSVNNMIAKDSVKERLQNPDRGISFTEFTYQLLQAEDFRHLFKTRQCILQIGGSDQFGNCVAGIDLIRRAHSQEAFALTIPLLVKSDGNKFGKSEQGNVWLDKDKTSVFDFFQFFIKTEDADVIDLLKKLTFLSLEEIKVLEQSTEKEPHLRKAQNVLAQEVTKLVHGEEAMNQALEQTKKLFGQVDANSAQADLVLPLNQALELNIVNLLVTTSLSPSKGQARRDIEGGGIRVNGEKVLEDRKLTVQEVNQALIISKGKSHKKIIKFS